MAASASSRRVVTFVFLTVFLDLVGYGIVFPLMPFYVKSMGGTAETLGWLLSLFSTMQLLATPVMGRISDRVGRRPVILISLAGNAVAMAIFAAATWMKWLPLLFVSRMLAGGTSGNLAACQAAIADTSTGEDRAKGMGLVGAGIGLGFILGPVLGGLLAGFGPWAPPILAGAMAALDFFAALFLMPETHHASSPRAEGAHPPPHGIRAQLAAGFADRRIVAMLGLYFIVFLCLSNMQVALALVAHVRFDWGEREIGQVFGLFGMVSLIIQGGLIGRLSRAFRAPALVLAGLTLVGVGMAIIGLSERAPVLIAGLVVLACGFGVTQPMMSTLATDVAGAGREGAVLGAAQSFGGIARVIGPVWGGFLFARIAPGAPFLAAAITACLGLFVAVRLRPDASAQAA